MNVLKLMCRWMLGVVAAGALVNCAAVKEPDARAFVREGLQRERTFVVTQMARRSLLANSAPPNVRALVNAFRPMNERLDALRMAQIDTLEARLERLPTGAPFSPTFLARDPDLKLHRVWITEFRAFTRAEEGFVKDYGSKATAEMASFVRAHPGRNSAAFERGFRDSMLRNAEAIRRSNAAAYAFADALEDTLTHMERTRGRWTTLDGKLVFMTEADTKRYNELSAKFIRAATSLDAAAAPEKTSQARRPQP